MAINEYIKKANSDSEFTPERALELKRCGEDPIYFMRNYAMIQHPMKGSIKFDLYEYQERMVRAFQNNRYTLALTARQQGKTTVAAIYLLWLAMFREDKFVLIASKSMSHALEIMARAQFCYEMTPSWLKPGCKYFNRTSMEFDNKSKIKSEATTEKTGRGGSPALIYLDELAFVERRIQMAMWTSLQPSLSTGGSCIVSSTPNGDSDLFATLWRGANAGTNDFYPLQIMWDEHPDRGEEYLKEMYKQLGELMVKQEVFCEFVSSDSLLINSLKLSSIRAKPPVSEDMGFKFWKTDFDISQTYIVGVDVGTGIGSDFSVIQVVEFPSLIQVAEFRSNSASPNVLYAKIKWILNYLKHEGLKKHKRPFEAVYSFENNGVGQSITALYMNDENQPEYDLMSGNEKTLGFVTTSKSKVLSCMQLKSMVEKTKGGLTVNSETLLFEMKNFMANKSGTYAAKAGATDDCISAMLIVLQIIKRMADYDSNAFNMVYEYDDPYAEQGSVDGVRDDEPVPFSF